MRYIQFLAFTAQDRDFALYRLALMTGMRRGEMLGLRWRDLDLAGARINTRQQWTKDGDLGRRFKGLKTGSKAWRTIDIDQLTVETLRHRRQAQQFERRILAEAYRSDLELVFCHQDGNPYDPDVVSRRFERLAAAAGLPVIRLHDARHTHATLLLENGESLKYVAERLGDREDTVLEVYGHVTSKMRSGAVSRMVTLIDSQPVSESECEPVVSHEQ